MKNVFWTVIIVTPLLGACAGLQKAASDPLLQQEVKATLGPENSDIVDVVTNTIPTDSKDWIAALATGAGVWWLRDRRKKAGKDPEPV